MRWTKPDYEEIMLGMEVTAYVNTDDQVLPAEDGPARTEPAVPAVQAPAGA